MRNVKIENVRDSLAALSHITALKALKVQYPNDIDYKDIVIDNKEIEKHIECIKNLLIL